jgi:H+/Cl- antiporter ClcA
MSQTPERCALFHSTLDASLGGGPPNRPRQNFESFDYRPPVNLRHLKRQRAARESRTSLRKFASQNRSKAALLVVAGACIGATALALQLALTSLVDARNAFLASRFSQGLPAVFSAFLFASLPVVIAVATLVQFVEPRAAGAGVANVVAFLNGNDVSGLLTWRVYLMKMVGMAATGWAALALGPEGMCRRVFIVRR